MTAKILFANNIKEKYTPICDWPEGTILVPQDDKNYNELNDEFEFLGFYFEVYTKNPDSYFTTPVMKNIEDAEKKGFEKYLFFLNCHEHEFERRRFTSGSAICKKCGLFKTNVFPPAFNCKICGIATDYCKDDDNKYYCIEHENFNHSQVYISKKQNILKRKQELNRFFSLNNPSKPTVNINTEQDKK